MSVTNEAPIAIGFSIAANASPQRVAEVIDLIQRTFGISPAPGVAPATAAATQQNTTPTPAAAPTGTGPELDSSGLPWNEQIHSSAKSKKNDGTWTKRKGCDDATYARVSTELRAAMAAGGAPANVQAPQLPSATPTLPNLPQSGPVVPALPSTAPSIYQNFVAYIATQLNSPTNPTGRLTSDWVDQVIAGHGVPGGIANLANREDLVPTIEGYIKSQLGQ